MADHKTPISRRQALGGIVSAGALAASHRRVEAQTWGRVFIFNTAPEKVQLKLNRRALPAIIGTEREAYYIPDVISVDRTQLVADLVVGEFADRNKLHVRYSGNEATYAVAIDPAKIRLDRDLQLYVHRDGLIMLHDGVDISHNVRKIS
jgi:hypothetical protein